MRLLFTLLFSLCLMNAVFTQSQSAINGTYQVEGIECIIDFNDGEAKFHFNPNLCITSYSILDSTQIRFQNSKACTKICCDDELDILFIKKTTHYQYYKLKNNNLYLYGTDTLLLINKAKK